MEIFKLSFDPAKEPLLRPIRGVVDGQLPTLGRIKVVGNPIIVIRVFPIYSLPIN